MLRSVAMACTLGLCATAAHADAPTRTPSRQNFWDSLLAPHEQEIQLVLQTARNLRAEAFTQVHPTPDLGTANADTDAQRAVRDSMLREALGMLAYARRALNPRHPEVLLELGRTADDLGRHRVAIDALETYLRVVGDEAAPRGDAWLRLGRIHAHRGEWDLAVRAFRAALTAGSRAYEPQAALFLGCAYMHMGRLDDAIDALSRAATIQPGRAAYLTYSIAFALAVAYDRDEQITAAYDLLDTLSALDPQFTTVLGQRWGDPGSITPEPLITPGFERHYFAALRYEAIGQFVEARAEWRAFARAATDSPYRPRAQAHIVAIDAMLDDAMKGSQR